MFPKVVQVIPEKNYSVFVYFEDGKIVCYDPSLPLVNAKWSLLSAPFPCIYVDFTVFMRVKIF